MWLRNLLCILVGGAAAGSPAPSLGESPPGAAGSGSCVAQGIEALSAERCPSVFGDDAAIADNRKRRQDTLESVVERVNSIDIVHRGDWRAPEILNVVDLRLVATAPDEPSCGPAAVVELIEPPAWTGCAAGPYVVSVDRMLGDGNRVLAVVTEGVLLERDGELAFLLRNGADEPTVRMTWHAPFTVARPVSVRPGSQTRPNRRPPHRRNRGR